MNEKRTGLFENGLIWFGAGVSIAEILTGTYLAPLGMGKGLAAILIGHIIGCLMLFLAGVLGGMVFYDRTGSRLLFAVLKKCSGWIKMKRRGKKSQKTGKKRTTRGQAENMERK